MALVCDTKSSPEREQQDPPKEPDAPDVENEDLEDGEIEDDEEEAPVEAPVESVPEPPAAQPPQPQPLPLPLQPQPHTPLNKFHNRRFDRDRHRHEERKRGHLTEAEKSVMHLHKLERIEREKRERFKREQVGDQDDFAINIEKAIANVLKRKQGAEEKEEDRGKKRKKKEKDRERKKMKGRNKSPKPEDFDETELLGLKRSISEQIAKDNTRSSSPPSDYDSYESSESSDRSRDKGPRKKRDRQRRSRSRERKPDPNKDPQGTICVFSVQGKCNKGDDCPFIHEGPLPMKLELCKFYLNECCAKGDKCLYMHSEFPCKFYHTGLKCQAGDSCKFAHGKPLYDGLKQILYKHIETAPKEILGDFPRLSRDGALNMINQAQKALEVKYGAPGDKRGEIRRNRPSRWQDADPSEQIMGLKGFYSERDHDMRINSNGDIDMRTLPPHMNPLASQLNPLVPNMPLMNQYMEPQKDIDIRARLGDLDIRHLEDKTNKDVDIRHLHFDSQMSTDNDDNAGDESNLQIVMEEDNQKAEEREKDDFPANLPKKQRELFLRIQAQQKENVPENQKDLSDEDRNNIDWYSDDDDDCRLTIKDDVEDRPEDAAPAQPVPAVIEPVEVIEKLGDLSKIDISEEVTKLLSSISQSQQQQQQQQETKTEPPKDPRLVALESPKIIPVVPMDPRKARLNSTEKKPERISIYEQGSISMDTKDVDLRNIDRDLDLRPPVFGDTDLRPASGRADIDLRQLGLPFKGMQNYTPASEIDASINSHPPMSWKVYLVDIPRPDYTGLKLSAHDAQSTGDPRLRKIFRLSTEEKDSPASPKENAPKTIRQDPRRRREEKSAEMSYAQQLNILQTSAFYNSLTSSQKLLLNQELTVKKDGGGTDSTLNGVLANLGLVPGSSVANSNALTLLANVNNMNPMMAQQNPIMPPNQGPFMGPVNSGVMVQNQPMVQPGLLGAAPGVPNMPMPPDFQLNFDPRQGGLLGNAPPMNYNEPGYNNFNDDYYEGGGGGGGGGGRGGRGGRGGFRDRNQRRGRNFNSGRNPRSFRNNRSRSNRSRTSP